MLNCDDMDMKGHAITIETDAVVPVKGQRVEFRLADGFVIEGFVLARYWHGSKWVPSGPEFIEIVTSDNTAVMVRWNSVVLMMESR